MSFLINPYRYVTGGGGLPQDVIAYASVPTGGVFDWQGLTLSGYQRVILYLDEIVASSGASPSLHLRFYVGGVLQTASYRYAIGGNSSAGTSPSADSQSGSAIVIADNLSSTANLSAQATVQLDALDSTALYKLIYSEAEVANASGIARLQGFGHLENAGAVNGIRVFTSAGSITSGRAMLLAMPTS